MKRFAKRDDTEVTVTSVRMPGRRSAILDRLMKTDEKLNSDWPTPLLYVTAVEATPGEQSKLFRTGSISGSDSLLMF